MGVNDEAAEDQSQQYLSHTHTHTLILLTVKQSHAQKDIRIFLFNYV